MARTGSGRAERVLARMVATADACADALDASAPGDSAEAIAAARHTLAHLQGSTTLRGQQAGDVLVSLVAACRRTGTPLPEGALALAVRALAADLELRHGGHTIEMRIPPMAAAQVAALGDGPTHTRGTPPNVVETDPETWFDLATGRVSWQHAVDTGLVSVSGSHATDVAAYLPIARP